VDGLASGPILEGKQRDGQRVAGASMQLVEEGGSTAYT